MTSIQRILVCILFLGFSLNSYAQDASLSFAEKTRKTNLSGMKVLGGWAIGNMAVGGVGMWQNRNEKNSTYYFHEMNFYWNSVNFAIAGLGYLGSRKLQPENQNLYERLDAHHAIQKSLIFNAGLDIAYMTAGYFLMGMEGNHPDRNLGYGQALILQGGFLFVFDGIMFLVHQKNGRNIPKLLEGLSVSPGNVSWIIRI